MTNNEFRFLKTERQTRNGEVGGNERRANEWERRETVKEKELERSIKSRKNRRERGTTYGETAR